ncbi:hypothetical protein [Acetobacter fallax]|uniref:Uncharacterized protein n=1 Tax=Acetobacter fallax TaxID=1737473 RepID=A0ABX0KA05_9PROT|nr:hypothetical protein [Acetobacter fallax]NHO32264.1 hypothetical protein [Acetobacter fallax]NHO35824.1 hypothetical protein [Acetobacter fallax]
MRITTIARQDGTRAGTQVITVAIGAGMTLRVIGGDGSETASGTTNAPGDGAIRAGMAPDADKTTLNGFDE